MYQHRSLDSTTAPSLALLCRQRLWLGLLLAILSCLTLASAPALASVEETLTGPPDATPLAPHVDLPNLGAIRWPIDCSAWPQDPPADGYLASIFGHRIHSGGTDFHRGLDLRCDQEGDTCCKRPDDTIYCDERTCDAGDEEVAGAPIYALLAGTVDKVNDGDNNNLVIRTDRASNDISIGDTDCDQLFVWYQHMRSAYAEAWEVGDSVEQGELLGWQGKYGSSSVHLHLSTRACTSSRADGDPVGTLDPEINPFQLIGSDDGEAPQILSLSTGFAGTDFLVTVQIETGDPDFDQLEIAVYDAPLDQRHVRRLGYNSRLGIDVVGDDLDSSLLEPNDLSELTTIQEPDPPVATSGFTLTATFQGLNLAADPASRVQVKVADVFGNTRIQEVPIFGDAEVGDHVWSDDNGDGLQDSAEPGLPGVDVELYNAVGSLSASTVSDAQGGYSFIDLVDGDYFLRFTPPFGYGATTQVQGFPDLDSDVDPQSLETATFSLAAGQLDLSLDAGFTAACTDVTLVSYASPWRTSPTYTAGWNGSSFDDSGWSELLGSLGHNTSRVYSQITEDGLTSYFRLAFEVEDVTLFDTLDLSLYRDDGAVVYLNGVEVLRVNLPTGTIDDDTAASSYEEATDTASLPASHLLTGTNVLAVEVHNKKVGNDLSFDLELRSQVCRACLGEAVLTAGPGTYLYDEKPDDGLPDDIDGADDEIRVDGEPEINALMAWDLSSVPTDAEVLHAELIVEVTDESSSDFRIFAMSREWDEDVANWTDASGTSPVVTWGLPGANGTSDHADTPLGLVSLPDNAPVTGTVVLNVAGRALIQDWIDATVTNHGLMIHGDDGETGGLRFQSDDTSNGPRLRLIYASGCGD